MIRLLLVVSAICLPTALSRYCIESEKGWCRGHEIWGWCFHNKTSGQFDCDNEGFCVSQEQLKNRKMTGCFNQNNNTLCCCNDVDGCNLGFIPMQPRYVHGQACANTLEEPNEDIKTFKACDDPWCYAYLKVDAEGGLTTVVRGCHSRKIVMHNMWYDQHKKYNNNTKWMDTEIMASQPTCADIVYDKDNTNSTVQKMCLDFNFEEDGLEKKGRICCCRGGQKCNERFMWGDEGITKEELDKIYAKRRDPSSGASPVEIIVLAVALVISYVLTTW